MTVNMFRRDPDVVAAELDGAPRLLHLRSWTYLALDPVGERIWALLEEPLGGEALVGALLAEFEGGEAEIRSDVAAFLGKLREEGFILPLATGDGEGNPARKGGG